MENLYIKIPNHIIISQSHIDFDAAIYIYIKAKPKSKSTSQNTATPPQHRKQITVKKHAHSECTHKKQKKILVCCHHIVHALDLVYCAAVPSSYCSLCHVYRVPFTELHFNS